jgi:virginiamycin B lyase
LTVTLNEYQLSDGGQGLGIVAGPDGNLWFTENAGIGEINPTTHAINVFDLSSGQEAPQDITKGPDGNLWFTEAGVNANNIGRINPTTHAISEFPIPTPYDGPFGITAGPDGNLWFASSGSEEIGQINPATQAFSQFAIPSGGRPWHITPGPDGNLWFTERDTATIGRINPTTHKIDEFPVPGAAVPLQDITTGPDGNLWFASAGANEIGRINPTTQAINVFKIPTANSFPIGIAAGSDGNVWFTENSGNNVGRINPTTGAITEFAVPTPGVQPEEITPGPDGNLWFTEFGYLDMRTYQSFSNIGQVVPAGANPDLALVGTAASSVAIGKDVTYSLTVTNNGSGLATGVTLTDALPARATFVSATGGITPLAGSLTFTIGNLAAGASTSFSIVVTPGVPGKNTDSARVTMDQNDPTPTDNSVILTTNVISGAADLALSGTGPSAATFGDDVTYALTVKNDGEAVATNVMLTDSLPEGTGLVSSSGGTMIGPGLVLFRLGDLAPGASETVKLVVGTPTASTGRALVDSASVSMDQTDPSPADNSVSLDTTLVGTKGTACQGSATVVLLRFAEPVDPAWAKDVHNYQLVDREGSPRTIRLKSAKYNAATDTVTLKPLHQPNMHDLFQLTVLSDGGQRLTDAATSPAGGENGSGGPDGNLVIMIGIQDLLTRGTSPTSLRNFKWILGRQTLVMKRLGLE